MNYYEARQRQTIEGDLLPRWDWTCKNKRVGIWPTGACQEGTCTHATKEEAEAHESERVQNKIKTAQRMEIDTKKGHPCHVNGCEEKAFHCITAENHLWELCDKHLEDPTWYKASQIISSY